MEWMESLKGAHTFNVLMPWSAYKCCRKCEEQNNMQETLNYWVILHCHKVYDISLQAIIVIVDRTLKKLRYDHSVAKSLGVDIFLQYNLSKITEEQAMQVDKIWTSLFNSGPGWRLSCQVQVSTQIHPGLLEIYRLMCLNRVGSKLTDTRPSRLKLNSDKRNVV